MCNEPTSCLVQPIGMHGGEVMYFGCVCFRGELGFLTCDDIFMCVMNKQCELLEFVFDSVGLQYDEISLTFTAGFVSLCCACGLTVMCVLLHVCLLRESDRVRLTAMLVWGRNEVFGSWGVGGDIIVYILKMLLLGFFGSVTNYMGMITVGGFLSVTIILLLYSIFNKLGAMTFSLFIVINHVNRVKKYRYQITICICTLLFHIEGFLDCLSLQNVYHVYTVFVIDE